MLQSVPLGLLLFEGDQVCLTLWFWMCLFYVLVDLILTLRSKIAIFTPFFGVVLFPFVPLFCSKGFEP
jgi:hypothetical protein